MTENTIEQSLEDVATERLGYYLKEYVRESSHSDWEGFTKGQVRAVYTMLEDLLLYINNAD